MTCNVTITGDGGGGGGGGGKILPPWQLTVVRARLVDGRLRQVDSGNKVLITSGACSDAAVLRQPSGLHSNPGMRAANNASGTQHCAVNQLDVLQ